MESCDAMLAAIDNFEGAVIMVTHNEMFLHSIARRLIVFQDDRTAMFEGSYGNFLAGDGWADEDTAPAPEVITPESQPPVLSRKALKKKRSQVINARSKALGPFRKRITKIENDIAREENSLAELNNRMVEVSRKQDGKKIGSLSRAIHECQAEIDRRYTDLETVSLEFEKIEAEFDRQLESLEPTTG
jgi:ATP-binding cassette subfamily F protein 3